MSGPSIGCHTDDNGRMDGRMMGPWLLGRLWLRCTVASFWRNTRVCADAVVHPRGRRHVSAQTHNCIRAGIGVSAQTRLYPCRLPAFSSLLALLPPLSCVDVLVRPCGRPNASAQMQAHVRADAEKIIWILKFFKFLYLFLYFFVLVVACWKRKEEKNV